MKRYIFRKNSKVIPVNMKCGSSQIHSMNHDNVMKVATFICSIYTYIYVYTHERMVSVNQYECTYVYICINIERFSRKYSGTLSKQTDIPIYSFYIILVEIFWTKFFFLFSKNKYRISSSILIFDTVLIEIALFAFNLLLFLSFHLPPCPNIFSHQFSLVK